MKGLVRWAIKLAAYYFIVFPVVGGILRSVFDNWFGWLLGFIVATGVAVWLETTGLSNKILASIFDPNKSAKKTMGEAVGSLFESGDSSSKGGVETTMQCPNCGSQVTLIDGHGKCRACDSAF